jgi:hypothetical protein
MDKQTPIRLYDSVTSPNCHRVKVVLAMGMISYGICFSADPALLAYGKVGGGDFS